jgi:hypothetical protein
MTQNILIEFTSDTKGITTAEQAVEQLGIKDKALKETFKETNTAIKERDKAIGQNAAGLEKYAKELKDVEKAATGAFGVKALKEFETAGAKAFKNIITGATGATKGLKGIEAELSAGVNDALKEAGVSAEQFEQALKDAGITADDFAQQLVQGTTSSTEFGDAVTGAETKTKTFKVQLRELKDQLQQMEAAGQEGTQQFHEMSVAAAKLEDQIGDTAERVRVMASDTANLDAAVEGVQLLASGFQLAAGAAQLMGAGEEDVQKALVKLNAIMAITQGIQQVQNFLRGQSILAIKAEAVITNLNTAAQRVYAIAVGTSTGAMRVFRTALLATGIGAVIALLIFAAEKMDLFGDSADNAADKMKAEKDAADKLAESLSNVADASEKARNANSGGLDILQRQLALIKANGGAAKDVFDQEQKVRQAELFNLNVRLATFKGNKEKELEISKDIADKQNEISAAQLAFQKEQNDKANQEAQKAADKRKALDEKNAEKQRELAKQNAERDKDVADFRLQNEFEIGVRQHEQQVKLDDIEFGTKKEAVLDIGKMQVDTNKFINDTITENNKANEEAELKRIEAEEKKKADIRKQAALAVLNAVKEGADAAFEIGAERRQKELDDALNKLTALKDAELSAKNLTEQQKDDINKKYALKERQLKLKAFEEDKKAKRAQAIINGLLGVTNALATAPTIIAGIILAASVVATTAIQIAKINATQPGFRKGGYTGNKGRDEIAGVVHGQEYVATAEATKKYKPALEAMNALKFDEYIAKQFSIPTMAPLPEWAANSSGGFEIDYDKVGRAVAAHANDKPQMIMNFDENGASAFLISKTSQTQIRNKRYKV